MALHFLNLKSLADLDGGRIAAAFEQAVKRCALDCEDRPNEENARKVTLQVEILPTMDEAGYCDGVNMAFQVKDNLPTRKSRIYSLGMKASGALFFSDEDPLNHRQLGLDDADDTGRAHRDEPR